MRETVKRIINFRFDRFGDTEVKLEKMAAKGLFLEKCGNMLWTFRKGEPKKLKYSIAFSKVNEQNEEDDAEASDWNLVTRWNHIQIFSSDVENPEILETDEQKKFEQIKKCMKRSFVPSMLIMIFAFAFNLISNIKMLRLDIIEYLSDTLSLIFIFMITGTLLYFTYSLLDYFGWCRRTEKSIQNGGKCDGTSGLVHKIIEISFMALILVSAGYCLINLAFEVSFLVVVLIALLVPIAFLVFNIIMKFLKKKKVSTIKSLVISCAVLVVTILVYFSFTFKIVISNETYSANQVQSTILLKKSVVEVSESPLFEYKVVETRFDSIYDLARKQLFKDGEWLEEKGYKYTSIDHEAFGAKEAYQRFWEDEPMGKYLLFYPDKIIQVTMNEPATASQIKEMKELFKTGESKR